MAELAHTTDPDSDPSTDAAHATTVYCCSCNGTATKDALTKGWDRGYLIGAVILAVGAVTVLIGPRSADGRHTAEPAGLGCRSGMQGVTLVVHFQDAGGRCSGPSGGQAPARVYKHRFQ